MPVVFQQEVVQGIRLCVWQIVESEPELWENLQLLDADAVSIRQMPLLKRRVEKLACRQALAKLLGSNRVSVTYGEVGEPRSSGYFLSFSHGNHYVAVVLSPSRPVGIDIELISSRILSLSSRFLSPEEALHVAHTPEMLTCCWCAKEAIYKMFSLLPVTFPSGITVDIHENKGIVKYKNNHETIQIQDIYLQKYIINSMMIVVGYGWNLWNDRKIQILKVD
ncbi:MAG: 4'-phosphopantetheinyl transferase superfamily protein [Bacteroidales bacterium]|jgi:phosphopantetheinyl transferase|nr:4'-phosphopantetheinyl transferase superfamily protein [Bacteroidales bacterium]